MKIYNRSLLGACLVSLAFTFIPWGTKAQNPLTAAQRTIVINRTDSVMNLYKRYSTFVEDAGSYSTTYASQFVKLFGDKALLINDIDPALQMPVNVSIPLPGIDPAGYVGFVQKNYPKGIGIADFFVEKRSEPIAVNGGKEYEIIVNGQKAIETFTVNDKLFKRDFPKYEIRITCKSNLTNFKINTITLTDLKITTPLPPVVFDEATVTIVNAEGKTLEDAIVTLMIDGKEVAQKNSKAGGKVNFKQLSKGKEVILSGLFLNDSLTGSTTKKYDEFIKQNITLTLIRSKTITSSYKILNSRTLEPMSGVLVTYKLNGKSIQSQTDGNGVISIPGLEIGNHFDLVIRKEGFVEQKELITISLKNKAETTIKLTEIPDEKEFTFLLGGGLNRPSSGKTSGQNWISDPGFAIGVGYNYYAKKLKMKSFDLGYYGNLSYVNSKFEGESENFNGQYTYNDIEGDACILNVTAHNIKEAYSISSIDLGFGLIFRKGLTNAIKVSLTAGPIFSISAGSSITINSGTVDYAGKYSQYYDVVLRNIPRLGYSTDTKPQVSGNSLLIKRMNLGLNLGASVNYEINKQIGATFGLFYRSIMTNMLSGGSSGELSYLNNSANQVPIADYKGLYQTQDKYTQSMIGLQLGLIYKLQ